MKSPAKLTKKERDKLWEYLVPYRHAQELQDYEGSPRSVPIFKYVEKLLQKRVKELKG